MQKELRIREGLFWGLSPDCFVLFFWPVFMCLLFNNGHSWDPNRHPASNLPEASQRHSSFLAKISRFLFCSLLREEVRLGPTWAILQVPCRYRAGRDPLQDVGEQPDPRASHWSRAGGKGAGLVVFEGIMTWQHRFQLLLVENKHRKMFAFPRTHSPAPRSEVCLW